MKVNGTCNSTKTIGLQNMINITVGTLYCNDIVLRPQSIVNLWLYTYKNQFFSNGNKMRTQFNTMTVRGGLTRPFLG